ncbi:hypothetical protein PIB30_056333 [Stylosanthes scabra]|uniref:Zinc finger GRF-type domain-containing protein n=1 Tax=Stylosanthes scabra TaxID=79078 RepID=A0ABU6ULD8_9FABA|nr:hypothetical protein [Stylosanthes scabra]
MESQGISSGLRRSTDGGDGRSDRSSSSTQGVFLAKVGDNKDGVAPKCHCGVYAILYLSKTANNPNRLFFGCPFFKLGKIGEQKHAEETEDVDEQFAMLGVENKIIELEDRLVAIERKNKPLSLLITGLLIWVISLYAVVSMKG